MKRRTFVKATAAAGLQGILASHMAPAFAQGTTVHILRWNDFVPAADKVLREAFAPEVQKALGVKLNVETVNANDIPARATSAIQSGNGPDIIMLLNNYPHLYASSAVDVSDIAEEVGKAQGGIYAASQQLNKVGNQWVAMPWSVVPALIAYRKSWFEEAGAKEFPKTWQQYHEVGKKLKAAKRPIGQTLGNTFGDAPTFTYPLLWSYGAQEIDAKGKVVLDSKETVESVRFMTQFWKDGHDEGGLAWDDTNNNRAFLSGVAERRLDLRRGAERRRQVQDREGRAAAHRHPARSAAGRAERPARLPHGVQPHGHEVLEERQGGEGFSAVGAHPGELREMVRGAEGLRGRNDARVGKPCNVAERSGDAAVQDRPEPAEAGDGLRRAARQACGRGVEQVHRHRDVRAGRERQVQARGLGQVGRGRAGQDLHLIRRP
jgi:hypothetical protein